MLHPGNLRDLARQVNEAHPQNADGALSKGVYGDGILQKMNTQYDSTQYGAIVVSNSMSVP